VSTRFIMNKLANVNRVRLTIYNGGHSMFTDLEPEDVEELAREATQHAKHHCSSFELAVLPTKRKTRRAK
jgi:hypothetical protein